MRAKGLAYEELAFKFLKKQGLTPIHKNFQCRRGEIDLIMQHSDTLVFVEVRYRKNASFGSATESIAPSKQKKICLAASQFLSHYNLWDLPCRFDTVTITNSTSDSPEWIQNAFNNQL